MLKKSDIKEFVSRIGNDILSRFNRNGVNMVHVPEESGFEFTLSNTIQDQKQLKVAAIMDRFTLDCFCPECVLKELTPDAWMEEMEQFQPELLFLESAWEGKNGLWRGKVNHCTDEVRKLTQYCHEKGIPVVFWNKEDPVFTDTFMAVARRADFVFTTDIDCIQKYKTELGHENVFHLHFAAQPRIHNPIESFVRKDKVCFAGAYYHRYENRCRVFDHFFDYFVERQGFDIFDRNYLNARPEHKFPEKYDPYILGNLKSSEIDVAYKGYLYGINMNSINQSQTMFARRVFELIASNTVVVGNFSRGVKNYFGDLTFCTDDEKTLKRSMEQFCADKNAVDKLRLLALRKVLSEHLCEDRLDYVVKKVFHRSLMQPRPWIFVYSFVFSQEDADRICRMFRYQTYERKKLLLVTNIEVTVGADVCVMRPGEFEKATPSNWAEGGYIACFSDKDWYGPSYLLDLALTTRYGDFDVIGKGEYFSACTGVPQRESCGSAYRFLDALPGRCAMIRTDICNDIPGEQLLEDRLWRGERVFACDVMNYCRNWTFDRCPPAEDMYMADQGLPLKVIEETANNIKPVKKQAGVLEIPASTLVRVKVPRRDSVQSELVQGKLILTSHLPEETHRYYYLQDCFDIKPCLKGNELTVFFHGEAEGEFSAFCFFYDKHNNKLGSKSFRIGRRGKVIPPDNTDYVKIAFRVRGPGSAIVETAEFGGNTNSNLLGGCFLSRSNVLVLTNNYPTSQDIYRNMFVHKRVRAYAEQGKSMDVMRMSQYAKDEFREFEGINVVEGHEEVLNTILKCGQIDTVCVHFLDRAMWDVLREYLGKIRLIIWAHGADIQPWWRREFLIKTEEDKQRAMARSDERMTLWREVFAASEIEDISFVFVSRYFADQVFEDYRIQIPTDRYHIIHNFIDCDAFGYVPKSVEDRKKILSIRPYASNVYANDLAVQAIQLLSEEEWFTQLEITFYGNGPLFDETLEPLSGMKNVRLEKKFLNQDEIVKLHKSYGIFLVPTRMDTQGVSRDEAMASGLVPVTSAVAAIPEFTDEMCAICAPAEDSFALAEGIRRLYRDPQLFLKMSENAAVRVREQSSKQLTINKELSLIFQIR